MASRCKKQQCTIDRRGFRQELDSWRHKLIHCVGFESILEGLIGPELVEDLKSLKDLKPVGVSDWSFDENCLFCCVRRDKVKEHLLGFKKDGLKDASKPLLIKDQITISRLEKQAEEFINAVLYRKDVPSFSDPHIPVVAREILQKMISQFAAEYTSKTSAPQDSPPHSDQSLPTPPLLSGASSSTSPAAILAGPAHNPVLSKLLMADQDAPLDLTIKKPLAEPTEQDGVLDLSIKKNRCSSSLSFPSPCLSPATSTIKGESPDFATKTKDLQSSSTLEQFMNKLCLQHQRRIVDAIGFLQSEVKAHASSNAVTPEKQPQPTTKTEVQEISFSPTKRIPEVALSLKTSGPAAVDANVGRHNDHAPLKMKILTGNGAGKKLSCVLNALSSQLKPAEDKQAHGARLSSSAKRFSQASQARQRETHAKDPSGKTFRVTVPPDPARTARKTIRGSAEPLARDSLCKPALDPDLGRCDIVFIDKPITECFKEQRRGLLPRRNARKSTRGHLYSDEIWELKTVRTLAGRGNCPNPMQELITLITPKQILSKPDAVPHADAPFVGTRREKLAQPTSRDECAESAKAVEVATCKVDDAVETSQTDQSSERQESVLQTSLEENTTTQNVVCEPASPALRTDEPEQVLHNGTDAEPSSITGGAPPDSVDANEPVHQAASPMACQVEERKEEDEKEKKKEEPQEVEPATRNNSEEKACGTSSADELIPKEPETDGNVENKDDEGDASSDRLSSLRKKKAGKPSRPKSPEKLEVIVGYVNGKPVSASDRSLRHRAGGSPISPSETPGKPQTDSASTDSNAENEKCEKHKPVKSLETSVAAEAKPCTETPSSPGNKSSPRTKQKQKVDAKAQQSPSEEPQPKRQLRSASQKTLQTAALPLPSKALCSVSPPDPSTLIIPSAESITSFLPFPPLLTSSPLLKTSESFKDTETAESRAEELPPAKETQTKEPETESEPRAKKLRSIRVVLNNKLEKQTSKIQASVCEAATPAKAETQSHSMPLRSKRILQKESEADEVSIQKESVECSASQDDGGSPAADKPTRMPLRSETSRADQSVSPTTSKKTSLRSQKPAAPSTSAATETTKPSQTSSPVRLMPERITKVQMKPSSASLLSVAQSSNATTSHKHSGPKQTPNKFLDILTREESQQLVTNLNTKYDKMQKGWVQMDKEGQPVVKYRNKSDRQAAIWKSKRRARKAKSSEQQKYSPVQMLFMKGFSLSSICRWFLESTETKSLVIVKKVNTRLPSETQLCFHSSSGSSGIPHGAFPSLQAERLKKHLKKFAIASPVKSNAKSQKLIAKALEQEVGASKGKEKVDVSDPAQTVAKPYTSAKASAQTSEPQKSSAKPKNPASARILRKYSNIKKKMQVQQTNARMSGSSKMLKAKRMKKPLVATKSAAKSDFKPSLKGRKPTIAICKRIKESAARLAKKKILAGKQTKKHLVNERVVKTPSKASKETPKKETPKRCSQRLVSPKTSEPSPTDVSKNKPSNIKDNEADRRDTEKSSAAKVNLTIQTKVASQTPAVAENTAEPQRSPEIKCPVSTDQVLTRNKRKMEAVASLPLSPGAASKRSAKATTQTTTKPARKAEEPAVTRSGVRHQTALLPRNATRRAQELTETPTKRTRTK